MIFQLGQAYVTMCLFINVICILTLGYTRLLLCILAKLGV